MDLTRLHDDEKRATGVAVGMAFCGPVGWIVMGVKAAEAKQLRDAYENLTSQIEKLKQDRQEETDLITLVTQLITQCDDIDQKITSAITAMKELSELFNEQGNCYDKIATYLAGMKTGTDAKTLTNRKAFVDYNMQKAINKLKEVCRTAFQLCWAQ